MDHISAARITFFLICQPLFLYRSKITVIILPWFFTWQRAGGMFWICVILQYLFFNALPHLPAFITILLWLISPTLPLFPLPILLYSLSYPFSHPNHIPHTFTLFIFTSSHPYPSLNPTSQLTLITHIPPS